MHSASCSKIANILYIHQRCELTQMIYKLPTLEVSYHYYQVDPHPSETTKHRLHFEPVVKRYSGCFVTQERMLNIQKHHNRKDKVETRYHPACICYTFVCLNT